MEFLLSLLSASPGLNAPQTLAGSAAAGLGWLGWLLVILYFIRRWRRYHKPPGPRFWGKLILLGLATPFAALALGLRLETGSTLPLPGVPAEPLGPALMIFAALPWMLAAGLLGPAYSAALAFLSGLLLAIWDTHHLFTPLEMALMAAFFSAAVNQRYRTLAFALLRRPLVAGALLALGYPLLALLGGALTAEGALAVRLDYALARLNPAALAVSASLFLGAVFTQVITLLLHRDWGGQGELRPAPSEKSLQGRFFYVIAPLAFVLGVILVASVWVAAERAARQMLHERMADAARAAADGVPFFLEAGQNLILQLAQDQRLIEADPAELPAALSADLRLVPFFTQLYVLDAQGKSLAGYPAGDYAASHAPPEEQMGLQLALEGVPFQSYTIPPEEGALAAGVSFVAALSDANGQARGVLIGRTDLAANPFTQPIIAGLNSLAGADGQGILLDERGRILYHANPALLMSEYSGRTTETAEFFDDIAADGSRQLVYYQPALGRPWGVLFVAPARRAQQLALNIAGPLLGVIVLLSVVSVVILRLALRVVTRSLETLAVQAGKIAQGELETPLPLEGEDEAGRLRRAFEQMRIKLKARLDEMNRLLLVSQGVASSLEVSEAVKPVLDSSLGYGAVSARIVLAPRVLPELDERSAELNAFAGGPAGERYAFLDAQVLALTRQKDQIVLSNLVRPRLFTIPAGSVRPQAVLAQVLRHENQVYGALWIAYESAHIFSDEETRFIAMVAGQAALAAANAHLFMSAEIGRQRLEAIINSTPDPVLVTDQQGRLLLSNPAAWRALGLGVEWEQGQPVQKAVSAPALLDLLTSSGDERRSLEVDLADGRIYYATASTVTAEGQSVGRVAILRDITYFKELDTLKSEFVATVSHDLRAPLTLVRGYATMLEMVGDLNEQQNNYVRRIISGVESMARLVNNLLDLKRIESGAALQLEILPVHDILERVVGNLQLQAAQKRVTLTTEIGEQTIPLIEADQSLIQQALQNLLDNAIKYTEPGGKVVARVLSRPDSMVFEIADTGIGIAPMDQPHLFEKFFRGGHPTDKKNSGTGLGLAIVKSIAERHNGSVRVESQLGKGSSFFLSIPLRQAREAQKV